MITSLTYHEGILTSTICYDFLFSICSHGVTPMEPNEPTYVAAVTFKDKLSFDSWVATCQWKPPAQIKDPEIVYYEGALVITNGM
jgi:hypothetical protein